MTVLSTSEFIYPKVKLVGEKNYTNTGEFAFTGVRRWHET